MGDELIGQAVEAVAADAHRVVFARDREAARQRAEVVVKRGVETGDLRQLRSQRQQRLDRLQAARLVQRRQRGQGVQCLQYIFIDEHRRDEIRAAMHDAMADRDQLVAGQIAVDPAQDVVEQPGLVSAVGLLLVEQHLAVAGLDGQLRRGVVFVEQAFAQ